MCSNLITRIYRPLLAAIDLTYPQYLIMLALWEEDDVSILNIQERTNIDGGSLSLILKKLEGKKFIQIVSCPADKRKKKVTLTHKGKCLRKRAMEVHHELKTRYGVFDESEFRQFVNSLDKLNHSILTKADLD